MRGNCSSGGRIRETDRPETEDTQRNPGSGPGRLSIVSLGPGDRAYIIPEALEAINAADVLVGYKMYLDLISDLTDGKIVISSGMRREMERCQAAIEKVLAGFRVALVSSGDAGIYGMAGLVFDICRERKIRVSLPDSENNEPECIQVEVIPGVSAFNAAASLVGAPLMHDFASISLSDHLTPWDLIAKRLAAVAAADFVIAIYNPRSKARPGLLREAQKILLRSLDSQTPVAIVRCAMRDAQWWSITTLGSIPFEEVDMQSVVIVGNSRTYVWEGWMVTPRGYLDKYPVEKDQKSGL